jgi:hypothetical protein
VYKIFIGPKIELMSTMIVDLAEFKRAARQFDKENSTPQKARKILAKIGAEVKPKVSKRSKSS